MSDSNQWGACIGDIDNDGIKDIFAGGSYDGVHLMRIGSGGNFEMDELDNGQMFMQACNMADLDNDGVSSMPSAVTTTPSAACGKAKQEVYLPMTRHSSR